MTCNYFEEYTNEYGKPDIIHAHNFLFAGVIAEYIKSKYGIKFIITEHSSLFLRQQLSYKEIQAVKSVAQSSDLVTAVSKSFINTLKKLIDNKIELLPNIVDDLFLKAEINLKRKPIFTFIHIGSLDYNKNQELLIRSFARLVRDELDVELIIAGDGAMKNRLKKITADLNLDKYIKFLGRISQSEIQRIMLDADCFVLSSNIETFGVVLIEALACGLPLIATKSGGPEDIINDSNGILIEIGNQNALEDAMLHIYQNSDKYKKESLREDARMRFGSDAFIKNVSSYYKQALKNEK
jgi:glycosyltransferase involved in cell wall biosynthesis